MTRPRRFPWLPALLAVFVAAAPLPAQDAETAPAPGTLERRALAAVEAGDLVQAERLLREAVDRAGSDPRLLYNLACVESRRGRTEQAARTLFRAVKAGFRDFGHMRVDPDLDPIRGTELYRAIETAAQRTGAADAEETLARWKRTYGEDGYRYEIDRRHRLVYATALDETAHTAVRDMLARQADHLAATLFGGHLDDFVLVAVPKPRDADAIFDGDRNIGGRYEHANRRLIARDIGDSLRHEFFHAFHYAHMERLGLRKPHALWIQEGLAALYEEYELGADGRTITFLPNERSNVTIRRARIGRLAKWDDFFSMSSAQFMSKALRTYPQAREIFRWVAEQDKLVPWYRAYVDTFAEDPTGALAFERTFERPLAQIEDAWRSWIRAEPLLDNRVTYGDASLGIRSGAGRANDGIEVLEVFVGGAADNSRLRVGDVIVAIDDRPTPTLQSLQREIASRKVGDEVTVRFRRRGRYQTTRVRLRALE